MTELADAARPSTVFAFDLDGTITSEEVLPVIAAELGLEREMEVLTDLTLSGAIPFQDSFRLRCAILRAVPISRVQDIVAEVLLSTAIAGFIAECPERSVVVTGNLDVWVRPLLDRLGCRAFTSVAQTQGDTLLSVRSVLLKSDAIRDLRRQYDRVVAVGDSVNDIPMFELADMSVAFGGVHPPAPDLVDVADYVNYEERSLCRLLRTLS